MLEIMIISNMLYFTKIKHMFKIEKVIFKNKIIWYKKINGLYQQIFSNEMIKILF